METIVEGFQRILAPVDFSELSVPTVDMAARLLAPDGEAVLLHVVEWMPAVTGGTFGVYPHRKEIEQIKRLSLDKLADWKAEHSDVRIRSMVREGKPATTILEVAAEEAPDLIVIGSHGRGGLDHLLLGSVTERVLRKADAPVLVVRGPDGR